MTKTKKRKSTKSKAVTRKNTSTKAKKARTTATTPKAKETSSKMVQKAKNEPKTITTKRQKPRQPRKNKNVSQTIHNGTMIHTRDEYIGGSHRFNKNGTTWYYRKAIVVDSNRNNDLALIKLTTSKKGEPVPGLKKSRYRPFIETKDNDGRPIRLSNKFVKGKAKNAIPVNVANEMKKVAITDELRGKENRRKLRKLKWRK